MSENKTCIGCPNQIDVYYGKSGISIYELCKCRLLTNNMTVDRFNPKQWCPIPKGDMEVMEMKVEQARKYFITRCEEKIQDMKDMPSTRESRVSYYQAAVALLPYLPTASDAWIAKHEKADSSLIAMQTDMV